MGREDAEEVRLSEATQGFSVPTVVGTQTFVWLKLHKLCICACNGELKGGDRNKRWVILMLISWL